MTNSTELAWTITITGTTVIDDDTLFDIGYVAVYDDEDLTLEALLKRQVASEAVDPLLIVESEGEDENVSVAVANIEEILPDFEARLTQAKDEIKKQEEEFEKLGQRRRAAMSSATFKQFILDNPEAARKVVGEALEDLDAIIESASVASSELDDASQ